MNKLLLSVVVFCTWGAAGAMAFESMEERAAKEMAKYTQTGEFEKCVSYNMIKKTVILDDSNILFELKNDKYMLNTMKSECKKLAFEKQFSYAVSNNKICGKDIISTRRGTCSLSSFEILDKKL